MDAAVWGFIGVVIGGIVTGLATVGVEWVRSDHESSLDRAKRADDRRLALDHFQRETLLALQDALIEHARLTHGIYAIHRSGEFRHTAVPPELDEQERLARQRVTTYKTRVADEEVRGLVDRLIDALWQMNFADNEFAEDEAYHEATQVAGQLTERIGMLIRATFRAETPDT